MGFWANGRGMRSRDLGAQIAHKSTAAICAMALSTVGASANNAADFSFYIYDMPLASALQVLGRDLDVEFMVDGPARMRVRDVELHGDKDAVIRDLMQAVNMDAFFFNGQMYVAPSETREVRLVRLGDVSAATARQALDEAGLIVPEFSVSEVAGGGALVLSGPVKYLAISESVIASLRVEPVSISQAVRVRRAGRLETTASNDAAVNASTE